METNKFTGGSAQAAPLLSDQQKQQFIREGYVVARGLLPNDIVEQTHRAIMTSDAWPQEGERGGSISVPLWKASQFTKACRTPEIEQVGEELVGSHLLRGACFHYGKETAGLEAREEGFVPVVSFPVSGPRRFEPPDDYHLDGYPDPPTLWPRLLAVIVLAYLTDTADYGGATVVLPGSHRQVFEYWCAHGIESSHAVPPLKYSAPVALAGKAGDVIFMHYLLVHSGSRNFSDHARIGMNTALMPDPVFPYQPKTGPADESWTPLDYTLRTYGLPG
jgi:hypothetical protein